MSDIRSFPTQGYNYKVIQGDRITFISNKAYGDRSGVDLILDANSQLQGRPISLEDLPTIYPGDVLFIPNDPAKNKLKQESKEKLPDKSKNDFTLIVAGQEIPIQSGSFTSTIDTLSDGWTAKIAWEPGKDKNLDRITKKYSYSNTDLYIGGELQASGKLYNVEQELSVNENFKTLEFFSHNYELVRNTSPPPYQENNVSLLQRCEKFAKRFSLNVEIDSNLDDKFENDINSKFKRVTIEPTETIFEHLRKLAKQRGVLLTSNKHGDILLTRAAVKGKIVGTLREGESPFPQTFRARFDGTQRFATYRLIGQAPGNTKIAGTAKDETVSIGASHTTISANDTTSGDIKSAAEYEKNKHVADTYSQDLPLTSWYLPKGDLIERNTLIDVVSQTIDAPDGFTFLIRRANYNFETGGLTSTVSIVPPSVYTTSTLEEAE